MPSRRLFRLPFSRATLQRDIDEELAFHIDSRIADLVAAGHTRTAAEEITMHEFGDVGAARSDLRSLGRRRLRRMRRADAGDALRHDARYALRGIRREPGFAAAVVLTLALGVGANAAMFGVADQLLLRAPAGVADPEAVVRIGFDVRNQVTGEVRSTAVTTYRTYAALREELAGAVELAAFTTSGERSLGRGEDARPVRAAPATHSYFDVLGVRPALGRFFTAEEDSPPQGAAVAVLSHSFWQRHFGGAPDALGRTLEIDRETYTVIGVAPRGFNGLDPQRVDVWLPVSVNGYAMSPQWHTEHNVWWLRIVGRVAPAASPEAIAAQATAVDAREHPARYERDDAARVSIGPLVGARTIGASPEQERANRVSMWLLGVSAVVLLIACANVANLLLARALRRRRELGVRVALGVGRRRLVSQVFTEILMLALAGGALGLLLAAWSGPVIRNVLLPDIHWEGSAVDGRVLIFSLGAVLAAALLAGLVPALHTARTDVAGLIRSGGRNDTGRRSGTRKALVVAQAALCVLLLVGAGLFVRSLRNAQATDLGFDASRVVTVDLNTWAADLPVERARALNEIARERLGALPGVEEAAVSISTPFMMRLGVSFSVPGLDSLPRGAAGGPYVAYVSPEYFGAMKMPIVRGRGFTSADAAGAEPVVVLTATLARELFGATDPLGACLHFGTDAAAAPCTRVVGIANDVRFTSVDGPPTLQLFIPLAQSTNRSSRTIVLRTAAPPGPLLARIGETAQALDPALPLVRVQVLQELADPQIRPWRMGATLFSAFGALALLLAAVGLYSVIAYDVMQRRQELGVRVALGAGNAQLRRMIFGDAAALAVPGLALGLAAAFVLAGRLEPILYHVSPRDPLVFAAVAAALLVVGAAAALLPARRATRVDPLDAMRME